MMPLIISPSGTSIPSINQPTHIVIDNLITMMLNHTVGTRYIASEIPVLPQITDGMYAVPPKDFYSNNVLNQNFCGQKFTNGL